MSKSKQMNYAQYGLSSMARTKYNLAKGEFVARIHENHHNRFAFCHIFDRNGERVMAPDNVAVALAALPWNITEELRHSFDRGSEFVVILGSVSRPSSFHYFVAEVLRPVDELGAEAESEFA